MSSEEPEWDERLISGLRDTVLVNVVINLLCSMLSLSTNVVVLFLSIKRGNLKKLPLRIRVAFIMIALMQLANMYLMVLIAQNGTDGWKDITFKQSSRIVLAFGSMLWIAIHWQFAAYYM